MSFSRLLPFDTDDPSFARGFEAGRVWQQINAGETFDQTIHATNAEMIMRMAEATDVTVTATILDDTWMNVRVDS